MLRKSDVSFLRIPAQRAGLYLTHIQLSALDHTLGKLRPALMDGSSRPECLPGTRSHLLRSIMDWIFSSNAQRILWLHGLAGSGKSTLSTTISNHCRAQGCLGAFAFFNRDVEERNQPWNVVRTLAYQLGSCDVQIGTAIAAAIDAMPSIAQSALRFQFTKLLLEPLSALPTHRAPVVLILDALDECRSGEGRRLLLKILAAESIHLPSFARILITSRADFDIRAAFIGRPHIFMQELGIASEDNIRDISSFLHSRMTEIRVTNPSLMLPPDWPGQASLNALGHRASGLFAWASTACRFIEGYDPQQRLGVLLQGAVHSDSELALDSLYQTALMSAGLWDDDEFCTDFNVIMGTILIAKNPLSCKAIDNLLFLNRSSCHTLSRLRCVLSWSDTTPIRILHPSFADFLSDPRRCGSSWYINTSFHNRSFAVQCLHHLYSVLKRNICDLKLSPAAVDKVLPEETSYAAGSWINHIIDIKEGEMFIAETLELFFYRHLLHWLEVMSILKQSRTTISSLRCLLDWSMVRDLRFSSVLV